MKGRIGYLGLGKMGLGMATLLMEKGWSVEAWNRGEEGRAKAAAAGLSVKESIPKVIAALPSPRTIWMMVPASATDGLFSEVLPQLSEGDTIIDGGNCFFEDSARRAAVAEASGVAYVDAGVSGGPAGARTGACVMVGGREDVVSRYAALFDDISLPDGWRRFGPAGAGHFVKMVHNGIEYGMMQAIAEGFEIMKKGPYPLDLRAVAELYDHGSVIESRLVGWLAKAYEERGQELSGISGEVAHTGEGAWTVKTAKALGIPAPIIEGSLRFREESKGNPSYAGQVLSALRNQFGGHDASDPLGSGKGFAPSK